MACWNFCLPVWDGQASIHSSLQGTEHLVACGGSCKTSIQVAGESAWLTVDALHIKLIACHLNLAFIHLIQAKLVQQLRTGKKKRLFNPISLFYSQPRSWEMIFMVGTDGNKGHHETLRTQDKRAKASLNVLCEPAADQCSRLLRSSSNPRRFRI